MAVTVKSYTRRTKSGKVIQVKAHKQNRKPGKSASKPRAKPANAHSSIINYLAGKPSQPTHKPPKPSVNKPVKPTAPKPPKPAVHKIKKPSVHNPNKPAKPIIRKSMNVPTPSQMLEKTVKAGRRKYRANQSAQPKKQGLHRGTIGQRFKATVRQLARRYVRHRFGPKKRKTLYNIAHRRILPSHL